MVFTLIILVLIAAIVYLHLLQGLFTSGISLLLAMIAALVSLGCTEVVVDSLLGGKFADYAHAAVMSSLFALTYMLLRLLFDRLVPGNVRFPLWVDRVGAVVLGLITALIATGMVTIVASLLPFGPSIAGYSRFSVESANIAGVKLPGTVRVVELNYPRVDAKSFLENDSSGLLIPVDDFVLGLFKMAGGEHGAMKGPRVFTTIHPDYIQELFGQRLAVEQGCKVTMLPKHMQLGGLFSVTPIVQEDAEALVTRSEPKERLKPLKLEKGEMFLVTRLLLEASAGEEKDPICRLAPSTVRLVARGSDGELHNYFPIGTLDGLKLYLNQPDDFVFVEVSRGRGVDFVFKIPSASVATADNRVLPGTILEAKRMARVDLGGMEISRTLKPNASGAMIVLRKGTVDTVKAATGEPDPATMYGQQPENPQQPAGPGGNNDILNQIAVQVDATLPVQIPLESNMTDTASNPAFYPESALTNGKLASVSVDPTKELPSMPNNANTLFSQDQRVVQVTGQPSQNDPWSWAAEAGRFDLMIGDQAVQPRGVCVRVDVQGKTAWLIRWNAEKTISSIAKPMTGVAQEVRLIYLVKPGSTVTGVRFSSRVLQQVSTQVP